MHSGDKNKIEEKEKEDILELKKIILKQDFIEFKEEIWDQKGGLSIGSPLSPVLADLYMDMVESEIFKDDTIKIINRTKNKTSHTLKSTSNVCPQHKRAAFNCYAHRLVNTGLSGEKFEKEKKYCTS